MPQLHQRKSFHSLLIFINITISIIPKKHRFNYVYNLFIASFITSEREVVFNKSSAAFSVPTAICLRTSLEALNVPNVKGFAPNLNILPNCKKSNPIYLKSFTNV